MNDYKYYLDIVKTKVSEKRYNHILGVVDEAKNLSILYNADINKAMIAASLHDITKSLTIDENIELIKKYDPSLLRHNPSTYHAYTGAFYSKYILGIDDMEIIDAIYYHTIPRINMSLLNKIIFVSDFTERGRTYKESEIAYNLARKDLDEAFIYIMEVTINYLMKSDKDVDKDTVDVLNYYKGLKK